MRKQLSDRITLAIFTRDRDLGANACYPGVVTNQWTDSEDGPVFYACPRTFGVHGVRRVLKTSTFDAIYLNSFFSPQSSILICRDLRRRRVHLPLLIAPRGEFSPGALSVKGTKKKVFLGIARKLEWYSDVVWHASTDLERDDILRQFPDAKDRIHVAADPVVSESRDAQSASVPKKVGCLRLVFISRISPMKNLDGLLAMLRDVTFSVDLDIFGPVEDGDNWARCEKIIQTLPTHVNVRNCGSLKPEQVSSTFAEYDLFAFPTLGENFGHVIFEALRGGTPVLISDLTPWQPDLGGAVTAVALTDVLGWRRALEHAAGRTPDEQRQVREAALAYADHYVSSTGSAKANRQMFRALAAMKPVLRKNSSTIEDT
jgi:glycosyltransferase involved in cell wall biosynthesis